MFPILLEPSGELGFKKQIEEQFSGRISIALYCLQEYLYTVDPPTLSRDRWRRHDLHFLLGKLTGREGVPAKWWGWELNLMCPKLQALSFSPRTTFITANPGPGQMLTHRCNTDTSSIQAAAKGFGRQWSIPLIRTMQLNKSFGMTCFMIT